MPLKRFDECGKKRHKTFGTDGVSDMPDQEQHVLDVWSILARTRTLRCRLPFLCMVEEPHDVRAIVACRGGKGI